MDTKQIEELNKRVEDYKWSHDVTGNAGTTGYNLVLDLAAALAAAGATEAPHEDFRHLLASFPEINQGNYADEDVRALNNWGIEVCTAYERLPVPAPIVAIPAAGQQWVSVDERLPEAGWWLTYVQTDYGPNIHTLELNTKGEWIYEGEPTYCQSTYFEPTHWMLLPAAPQPVKGPTHA